MLTELAALWADAKARLAPRERILQVSVTLLDITPASERQLDLLATDDSARLKWEAATTAIDQLNGRHGRTLVSLDEWSPPAGGYAGGKIRFTRVPSAEDFW